MHRTSFTLILLLVLPHLSIAQTTDASTTDKAEAPAPKELISGFSFATLGNRVHLGFKFEDKAAILRQGTAYMVRHLNNKGLVSEVWYNGEIELDDLAGGIRICDVFYYISSSKQFRGTDSIEARDRAISAESARLLGPTK